ncbi:MAG: sporulation protein YabP [Chloroflexota bacterium]
MDDKGIREDYGHKLVLDNREFASIEGVIHVESFDDQEIVLDTEMGIMTLRGEDMKIKQYDQEQGHLTIEGMIVSILYAPGKGRMATKGRQRGGFFDRLLR